MRVPNTGNGEREQVDGVVVRTDAPTKHRLRLYVVYSNWQLSMASFATCVCGWPRSSMASSAGISIKTVKRVRAVMDVGYGAGAVITNFHPRLHEEIEGEYWLSDWAGAGEHEIR